MRPKKTSPNEADRDLLSLIKEQGTIAAAASVLGISEEAARSRVHRLRKLGVEIKTKPGPRRIKNLPDRFTDPSLPVFPAQLGDSVRVGLIPDYHNYPGDDNARAKKIGALFADRKVEAVVQIGDFADFDSLSTHAKPGSKEAKHRPDFYDDLEALEECLAVFNYSLPSVPFFWCFGNHEQRTRRYDALNPEYGTTYEELVELGEEYNWEITEYGQLLDIAGVLFTHVPINKMGKEYSAFRSVVRDAVQSIVYGHSHRYEWSSEPKIGGAGRVDVLNCGCAMPDGHMKAYARNSLTGWSYGVFILDLCEGKIDSVEFVSMRQLEKT